MRSDRLHVRELAAWGFDESPYRPTCVDAVEHARRIVALRPAFVARDCRVPMDVSLFAEQAMRADLLEEMHGLDWRLGVVDLRGLIAFQRRVVFEAQPSRELVVDAEDWRTLFSVAFGPAVMPVYAQRETSPHEVVIETANPNLRLRTATSGSEIAFHVDGGSPFFEVASYRGRWFLRDGYHRAYALLRAGVACVPAVVVRARTLAELGPVGEWFFAEEVLFGPQPPLVADLLDDALTIEYTRPRMLKTIRISVAESFAPDPTEGDER